MVLIRKVVAEQILDSVDELGLWQDLLMSEDERIRLEALKYLTNRRDGQPPQSIRMGPEPEPGPTLVTCTFDRLGGLLE